MKNNGEKSTPSNLTEKALISGTPREIHPDDENGLKKANKPHAEKIIGFRCPEDLRKNIEAYAVALGKRPSELIRLAVSEYMAAHELTKEEKIIYDTKLKIEGRGDNGETTE